MRQGGGWPHRRGRQPNLPFPPSFPICKLKVTIQPFWPSSPLSQRKGEGEERKRSRSPVAPGLPLIRRAPVVVMAIIGKIALRRKDTVDIGQQGIAIGQAYEAGMDVVPSFLLPSFPASACARWNSSDAIGSKAPAGALATRPFRSLRRVIHLHSTYQNPTLILFLSSFPNRAIEGYFTCSRQNREIAVKYSTARAWISFKVGGRGRPPSGGI